MISRLDRLQGRDIYENTALAKLNEVIDAVNELQISIKPILEERELGIKVCEEVMSNMKTTDPYAEQRNWIGRLCKFRDNYEDKWHFGILEEIYQHCPFPFGDSENFEWAICEPVKPTDSIIYKGGDNE